MIGGEMRIPPHHLRARPPAHLLQCKERRSRLHVHIPMYRKNRIVPDTPDKGGRRDAL